MIYQFEYEEIKSCRNCPCHSFIDVPYDNGWCDLQDASISSDGRPKDNNCPLVAISKSETTSCEAKRANSDQPCSECRLYQRFILGDGVK